MLLVDTDGGIDDFIAILPAIDHIKAIFTVNGNCSAAAAAESMLLLGKDVYKGASPLVKLKEHPRWPGHGTDGLGNFSQTEAFKDMLFEKGKLHQTPACVALVSLVAENPGFYDLVCLGPLTNIALAISIDSDFLSKCKSVHIMGGCLYSQGNSSRSSEFNVSYDPESAYIVFYASELLNLQTPKIHLVPWETTVKHPISWKFIEELKPINKFGTLVYQISRLYHRLSMERLGERRNTPHTSAQYADFVVSMDDCILPDIFAVISCLFPEFVTDYKDWHVNVELHGVHSRGSTFFDWMNEPVNINCRVLMGFDCEKIKSVLQHSIQRLAG